MVWMWFFYNHHLGLQFYNHHLLLGLLNGVSAANCGTKRHKQKKRSIQWKTAEEQRRSINGYK
jgi:hypothetical protein